MNNGVYAVKSGRGVEPAPNSGERLAALLFIGELSELLKITTSAMPNFWSGVFLTVTNKQSGSGIETVGVPPVRNTARFGPKKRQPVYHQLETQLGSKPKKENAVHNATERSRRIITEPRIAGRLPGRKQADGQRSTEWYE